MKLEFDPAKSVANASKHGVSLDQFASLDFEAAFFIRDDRHAYSEERWRVLGPLSNRLYAAVFTMRGNVFRVISLRKANKRERTIYENAQNEAGQIRSQQN